MSEYIDHEHCPFCESSYPTRKEVNNEKRIY
jgi:hypothetical protein